MIKLCQATIADGTRTCLNKALRYTDYCWLAAHKAQRGEVYHQFALEGINTANVYETPVHAPLPASEVAGGRESVKKARAALEATKVSDPMKTQVRRGPLTIDTVGNIALITKENS